MPKKADGAQPTGKREEDEKSEDEASSRTKSLGGPQRHLRRTLSNKSG
jgi:hypothetical protein